MTHQDTPSRVVRESIVYGSGVFLSQFLSAVRGLVVAGLLGESRYGLWKSLQVGFDYLAYCHFGILHGMARRIPAFRSEGRTKEERSARRMSLFTTLGSALLAGLTLVLLTSGLERRVWRLWIGIAVLLLPSQLYRFLTWVCLVDGRFTLLSCADVSLAIVSFAVMWWFVPSSGVYGVFLGLGVGCLCALALGWYCGVFSSSPSRTEEARAFGAWGLFRDLVVVGFPFMLVDGLFVFWQRIDRVILVTLYGAESRELGHYGLAVMVASFAIQIPQTLMRVLFRRTLSSVSSENLGQNPTDPNLRKHIVLPTVAVAGTTPLLFGMGTVCSWAVIRLFLPLFVGAEASIALLMLACYWCSIGLSVRNLYTAMDRQWRLGGIYSIAILATVAVTYAAMEWGGDGRSPGIAVGAIGMIAGSVAFALISLADNCRLMRFTARQFASLLFQTGVPFVLFLAWVWWAVASRLAWDGGTGNGLERLWQEMGTCVLLTGPPAIWSTVYVLRRGNG